MVENFMLNGQGRLRLKQLIIAVLLPLYSFLLWFLGYIYNPDLVWSWQGFVINMLYCLVGIFLMGGAIDLVTRKITFEKLNQRLFVALSVGLSIFFFIQTLIVFIENLEDTTTVIITYSIGTLASAIFIIIHTLSKFHPEEQPSAVNALQIPHLLKVLDKGRSLHIAYDNIILIETFEKITFVKTKEGKQYSINQSLAELEELLPQQEFFRVNRQVIIQKYAIEKFERLSNNTFLIMLRNTDKTTTVSRAKTKLFQEWVNSGIK